jgi:hypothetical protein
VPQSQRSTNPFAHPLTLAPTLLGDPLVLQFGCLSGSPFPWPHRFWIDRQWVVRPFDEASWTRPGHLSCLLAAERATYAARHGLDLLARRSPPAIVGSASGWIPMGLDPSPSRQALHSESHSSPLPAARDARAPSVLATRFGADRGMVVALMSAVQDAYGAVERPGSRHAARECIRGPEGIGWLWDAGIPPEFVVLVHSRDAVGAVSLPALCYLAAALAIGPPPESLPRDGVAQLMERTGMRLARARNAVVAWDNCEPTVTLDDIVLLWHLVPAAGAPPRLALDRLARAVGDENSRRSLALILAVSGNVPHAEALWRRGVRGPLAAFAKCS